MIVALVVFPLVVALLVAMLPARSEVMARFFGCVSAALMLLTAIVSRTAPDVSHTWLMRPFTANLHLGLGSGVGYWLVILTTIVSISAIAAARVPRVPQFIALILALQGTMTGVFLARDLLVFALFWDLMLLPVFFVLAGWSGHTTAAWRYLIYNAAGGLTLLMATAAFGIIHGSTDVIGRGSITDLGPWGGLIFAGFAFAFLVKTPAFPLHTWMPETYSELPSSMAALVSGVQSKAGLYGLLVIGMPFFRAEFSSSTPLFTVLGLAGLLYGAFMALIQQDVKRVVAYSSLSHLGLILIALASQNAIAISGAVLYLFGHGLFSAALFLVLGYVELREDTRSIDRLGGLGYRNPRLAGAFVFSALAALGLPGLVGFAGELVIITGLYKNNEITVSLLALIPIVLAAAYMLRLFQNVMQGPQIDDLPQRPDLSFAEIGALAPLVLAIVLFGVAPRALLTSPPGATVIQAEPLNTLGIHAPAEHAVLRLAARGEHR